MITDSCRTGWMRRIPSRAVLVILGLLTAPAAHANPLPWQISVWHVHPWQSSFCASNPITDCSQAAQYTTATGLVEFDLYVWTYFDPFELSTVDIDVSWPDSWSLDLFDCCSPDGDWEETAGSNSMQIHLDYATPVSCPGGPYLVGRLKMNCPEYGALASQIQFNGEWTAGSPAQAGVGECYRTTSCHSWMTTCGAVLTPAVIELEAAAGETATGMVQAQLRWDDLGYPCQVQFATSAPWLSWTETEVDPYTREVAIEADATGLAPGVHETNLYSDSPTHDCALVRFTVTEPLSDVPEEPSPGVKLVSWGQLKGQQIKE